MTLTAKYNAVSRKRAFHRHYPRSRKVNKDESEILKIIEIYSNDSVSFYEFVEDINKNYSDDEKLSLLNFMWKTAYADGKLDVDEERLIRRLANLIKIKDIDVLKLKNISKTNTQ